MSSQDTTSTEIGHNSVTEFGFYQEGWRWKSEVAMKNSLLIFDGLAFLVPHEKDDEFEAANEWLIHPLRRIGMLKKLRPRLVVGSATAQRICESAIDEIVEYDINDHREILSFEFHLDKLGVEHHPDLVGWIFSQMAERLSATRATGNSTILLPTTLGRRLLHVVNREICGEYSSECERLRPLYESDHQTLHALYKSASRPQADALCPILSDMAALRIDVGHVPIEEITTFRVENRRLLEAYKSNAAVTAVSWAMLIDELGWPEFLRAAKVRIEIMRDLANMIEKAAHRSWRKKASSILDAGGKIKGLATGDIVGLVMDVLKSALDPADQTSLNAISYLITAKDEFSRKKQVDGGNL